MSESDESPTLRQGRNRYYTPDEARALLPEVRAVVAEMREVLDRGRGWAERAQRGGADLDRGAMQKEVEGARQQIGQLVERLQGWELDLKGLDPILVDFPGLRNGVQVCLCWREGEDTLEHWHPEHTGFLGRRPLTDTPPAAWEWCN